MIHRPPTSVLFACTTNAVRSPIAAALLRLRLGPDVRIASAGVGRGEPDPFAVAVMAEIGIDLAQDERPKTFEDLGAARFDVVIALSREARRRVGKFAVAVEYWPTPDATQVDGNREQRIAAYREVRDMLRRRIREYFTDHGQEGGPT
ncbi:MAG: low molecular weight phosphatase family protein [Alphaproteobacteria bacterium]|nr:low molecular weight phosphatase family protein [Alphaproteobacteria bacterium]